AAGTGTAALEAPVWTSETKCAAMVNHPTLSTAGSSLGGTQMNKELGLIDILASLSLLLPVIGFSVWAGLRLERSIITAALRAAVQLLAVGLLFRFIFEAEFALTLTSLWVAAMVVIAGVVIQRRAPGLPGLRWMGILAIGLATTVTVGIIIGLQILPLEPISLLVVAGISIGNALPSSVLAAQLTRRYFQERTNEVEAMLALGLTTSHIRRIAVADIAQVALVQQIERTRMVGLIAIPGTMTGLLLAGVDPVQAVLMQLVVMYLVLGSTALGVIVITVVGSRGAFTPDWRPAAWTQLRA
ncbi:MAG: ABC transporter permease, partial [Acidimicrobiales bacterium]